MNSDQGQISSTFSPPSASSQPLLFVRVYTDVAMILVTLVSLLVSLGVIPRDVPDGPDVCIVFNVSVSCQDVGTRNEIMSPVVEKDKLAVFGKKVDRQVDSLDRLTSSLHALQASSSSEVDKKTESDFYEVRRQLDRITRAREVLQSVRSQMKQQSMLSSLRRILLSSLRRKIVKTHQLLQTLDSRHRGMLTASANSTAFRRYTAALKSNLTKDLQMSSPEKESRLHNEHRESDTPQADRKSSGPRYDSKGNYNWLRRMMDGG